jgi:hypothetical protein
MPCALAMVIVNTGARSCDSDHPELAAEDIPKAREVMLVAADEVTGEINGTADIRSMVSRTLFMEIA